MVGPTIQIIRGIWGRALRTLDFIGYRGVCPQRYIGNDWQKMEQTDMEGV